MARIGLQLGRARWLGTSLHAEPDLHCRHPIRRVSRPPNQPIRYHRSRSNGAALGTRFTIGGSAVIERSPGDVATVVAAGATVPEAIEAARILGARGTAVRVIDAYSIKPIDER